MGGRARGEVVVLNSRWLARIVAVLILLAFFLLMAHLQSRLVQIKQTRDRPEPTSTR